MLIKDEEGKEMILSYLNQGDFIGELGLFEEGQERSAWVRAKTACEVAEKTAHSILLQGIRQFLPSLFVDNDEEIVEYAVKPLLAQSGPLDDIDVALRLIYALGKMDKWLYADNSPFQSHFPVPGTGNRGSWPD